MSSTAFGEHLKREREMRGVSLEEIANATRISTRFLEAIESERWDQLPGGVFNRGFIRSIARYLGMDEDSLVAEYDLDAKANGNGRATQDPPGQSMPRNWQPAAIAVALLAVLIGGGVYTYAHFRSQISGGLHRGASAVAAKVRTMEAGWRRKAAKENPAPSASSGPANASNAASSSAAAADPLTLKLEAGKDANVKIVADGKTVFDGPVHVNDVRQFQAREQFQVSSSESSALLLELNGQTVPPIGTPGQPGSVTLTRSDLTSSSTGEPH